MEGALKQESFEEQFSSFEKFWNILKEKGFHMMDLESIREDLEAERSIPVVHEGVDGVRVDYDKRHGISIWFTNGFEDKNDPTRKEIESIWEEVKNS